MEPAGLSRAFLFVQTHPRSGREGVRPGGLAGVACRGGGASGSPTHVSLTVCVSFQDEPGVCAHHSGPDQRQQVHAGPDERRLRQRPGSGTLLLQREAALQGGRTHDLTLPCAQQAALRPGPREPRPGPSHLRAARAEARLRHDNWQEGGVFSEKSTSLWP